MSYFRQHCATHFKVVNLIIHKALSLAGKEQNQEANFYQLLIVLCILALNIYHTFAVKFIFPYCLSFSAGGVSNFDCELDDKIDGCGCDDVKMDGPCGPLLRLVISLMVA